MSRNPPPTYVETNVDTYGIENRLDRIVELMEKLLSFHERAEKIYQESERSNKEVQDMIKLCNQKSDWESNSQ